jgi:hypothetical protein
METRRLAGLTLLRLWRLWVLGVWFHASEPYILDASRASQPQTRMPIATRQTPRTLDPRLPHEVEPVDFGYRPVDIVTRIGGPTKITERIRGGFDAVAGGCGCRLFWSEKGRPTRCARFSLRGISHCQLSPAIQCCYLSMRLCGCRSSYTAYTSFRVGTLMRHCFPDDQADARLQLSDLAAGLSLGYVILVLEC